MRKMTLIKIKQKVQKSISGFSQSGLNKIDADTHLYLPVYALIHRQILT